MTLMQVRVHKCLVTLVKAGAHLLAIDQVVQH